MVEIFVSPLLIEAKDCEFGSGGNITKDKGDVNDDEQDCNDRSKGDSGCSNVDSESVSRNDGGGNCNQNTKMKRGRRTLGRSSNRRYCTSKSICV